MAAPVRTSISATVGSPVVLVNYDKALDEASVPLASAYGFGGNRTGVSVMIAGPTVYVTSDTAFVLAEVESMNYTVSNAVRDLLAVPAPHFGGIAITVLAAESGYIVGTGMAASGISGTGIASSSAIVGTGLTANGN